MAIGEALDKLEDQIGKLSPQKQEVLSNGISVWADYLKFEVSSDPGRLMEYRRGDIVHVHFIYHPFEVKNDEEMREGVSLW